MNIVKFDDLPINENIKKAVLEMGFEEPSPIQVQAIPKIITGVDIIGQAQTGTGKTAAFSIPILDMVDPEDKSLQAVVLCPTRELAIQVSSEIRKIGKYMHGIKTLPVYGGQPIDRQIKSLKSGVQIVIGTPGRIIDHINRKTLKLDKVKMVILDEADEMLDMGFREDIEMILNETPENRQTTFFSATMPKGILDLTKRFQKNPEHVRIVRKELTVPNIKQYYIETKAANKLEVLCRLVDVYNPKLSVVFCNTKRGADELVSDLQARGYFADALHGDLKQTQRDIVMDKFRNGTIDILVATDVAARGIDVDDVEAVFNYDLPQDEEYYVHRIGRTGRAGRNGVSFTFVFGKSMRKMKDIERYTKSKLEKHSIPSISDVEEKKVSLFFDQVKSTIEEGHLTKQVQWLENFCKEEDYDTLDIAAALVKLALGDQAKEEIIEESHSTGAESGMTRLFINIGRTQKVQAKDIVGAIAGEVGIPGKLVGTIDIYDKYTFVEIPKKHTRKVLDKMKNIKIKGNKVNIEKANNKRKSK
ncbi:DEAD/DEAH box helicase family protein [[Clostridium] bifermentans ATCC 638]|uniref:ATP-dependent RNA helicase CshA n=1 Tax=Paraclostridium bifermentans ATCC 638 = DSM 14991 TaxID=1233171 RepID=T4VTI9_PARBF|nr:DEAD/DEAH box helicase [Paraclostridium bifermentans]EQK44773.1 DEAD/DEAH box helicase family protein [[Clostridium] bifermentans ATCC 638] [Paraclostridium bifermentans ATCC 638 = DSM 14991]RIZ58300.1 ATP-dependent RNA helicase [Paraclostridium bifermentans]UAG17833.1 DEAD/DEAH box helicase [Paraclostridium bifermentans]